MEQLAARRAHNPKVVWFESHSRYYEDKSKGLSSFFVAEVGRERRSNRRTKQEQRLLADYALQEGGKANCISNLINTLPLLSKTSRKICLVSFMPYNQNSPDLGLFCSSDLFALIVKRRILCFVSIPLLAGLSVIYRTY